MTYRIEAINSNIIFKFVEDLTQTRFINSSESGLVISSLDGNQAQAPRWGEVISAGPDCTNVKDGDFILIEPGKWTTGFYIDQTNRIWKTDESMVIAISDEAGKTY